MVLQAAAVHGVRTQPVLRSAPFRPVPLDGALTTYHDVAMPYDSPRPGPVQPFASLFDCLWESKRRLPGPILSMFQKATKLTQNSHMYVFVYQKKTKHISRSDLGILWMVNYKCHNSSDFFKDVWMWQVGYSAAVISFFWYTKRKFQQRCIPLATSKRL